MVFNLNESNSLANKYISQLRDVNVQSDSMRFRRNLERVGEILAYEISKTLNYKEIKVETSLGISTMQVPDEKIVILSILRGGLPFQKGFLNYFDDAKNGFIATYRRHHKDGTFDIYLKYISCPNLEDAVVIICDPLLATGASFSLALKSIQAFGTPKKIHLASVIAAKAGLNHIKRIYPDIPIWLGALDEELTAKSFIVPGLGDAGDLAFGEK